MKAFTIIALLLAMLVVCVPQGFAGCPVGTRFTVEGTSVVQVQAPFVQTTTYGSVGNFYGAGGSYGAVGVGIPNINVEVNSFHRGFRGGFFGFGHPFLRGVGRAVFGPGHFHRF